MKINNLTEKHNKKIQSKLAKRDIHISIADLSWLIKRYMYYGIKCIFHGYKLTPRRAMEFAFGYRYWEKGRSIEYFSLCPKLFGMEFFLVAEKYHVKKYGYQFIQGEYIKKQLEEELSSDIVYNLI